jgi:hypothetical protein
MQLTAEHIALQDTVKQFIAKQFIAKQITPNIAAWESLICVPLMQGGRRVPGVSVQRIEKFGMWSSVTAQIFFDEARVP